MDGYVVGFICTGVPLSIATIGLAFKVGRWNGKVTTKIGDLSGKIDRLENSMSSMRDSCDLKMTEVHKRINSIRK